MSSFGIQKLKLEPFGTRILTIFEYDLLAGTFCNRQIRWLLEIYDKLWNDAISALERGEQKLDPHLPDKSRDLRRGVTLVFRPPEPVRRAVTDYIGRLAKISPEEYFYRPEELHITALSIITMTEL